MSSASRDPEFSAKGQASTPFKEPHWTAPLVDRVEELANLGNSLQDAVSSKSYLVALEGEAGIGKTRLCRELNIQAHSIGVTVLSGRASEDVTPYRPWVELLTEASVQGSGDALMGRLGLQPSQIGTFAPKIPESFARLVPNITERLGTVSLSKPLEAQQDRIRLYDTITQFLISMSKERPLIVFLDDMQWADAPSLSLLEYFIRSTRNFRILTLFCYRTEETQPDGPLQKTLMSLNRERLLKILRVTNLDKEDTANLIKQIFEETGVSDEFADIIYDRTGGNPFFVEEILRSLVEEGAIFRTETKWDRKPIQELKIPESVKATLRIRLSKLNPETLSVMTWASLAGREFDFRLLREVCELQDSPLLERIESSIHAGLVSEVPNRQDVYAFTDNRIRQLLAEDLSQSRRGRYHIRIAEALEKLHAKNLGDNAEAIASHFILGGDTERSIKYSVIAGDRNRTIHAYEQAIADYKHASELIAKEGDKDLEKALILEKLGECYLASQLHESKRYFEEALVIYEKLNDNKACARNCLRLAEALRKIWTGGAIEESIVTLKRGLKYLEQEPESFEAASIYSRLGWYTGILDEWDEANSWADKALDVGERSKNSAALCGGLMIKGSYLTDTGNIDEGLPLWERAFETAIQHEHYDEAFFSLSNLAGYTLPRSLSKARELSVRLLDLSKRVNDMSAQSTAYSLLGDLDWFGGNWIVALEEHHSWIEIRKRIGLPVGSTEPFWYCLILGDLSQAEMELQERSKLWGEARKASTIVLENLLWGYLRLEQGRDAEAKVHFEKSVEAFRKWEFTTSPLDHIDTLLHLTKLHVKDGELEQARKTWEWAKRLAETLKSDAGLAMAYQAEGVFLLASEDRKGAEEAYLKSLGSWEKAGWPYYHAKALIAYSEAIAQTNPVESRKRLEEATETFRKLGAKRDLEKAEARLAGHS
jgi:tetratricopeptide (TPR) repeat protein